MTATHRELTSGAATRPVPPDSPLASMTFRDDHAGVYAICEGAHATADDAKAAAAVHRVVADKAQLLREALDASCAEGGSRAALRDAVQALFDVAGQRVREAWEVAPGKVGPTAMATLLITNGTNAAVAHVGRCRAYLVRGARGLRLTRDHTVAQESQDAGTGDMESLELVRAIGQALPLHPDIARFDLEMRDRALLVTGGITAAISQRELLDLHAHLPETRRLAEATIALAERRNCPTGVSAVALTVAAAEEPAAEATEPFTEFPVDEETSVDPFRYVRHTDLLQGLRDEQIGRLMALVNPVVLEPGATLFEQGDEGKTLYIVSMGRLDVLHDDRKVASVGPGSVVGELALLLEEKRTATVRAQTSARLLALGKAEIAELTVGDPHFALQLTRNLAVLLARRLRTTTAKATPMR